MSATSFIKNLKERAARLAAKSELRTLKSITDYTGRYVWIEGTRYLNVGSNDYLGMSVNKTLMARVQPYVAMGTGNCSSRLVLGNSILYDKLEHLIAEWKDMERALVLSSGYAINVAVMQALVHSEKSTVFLFDRLVHASMIDGVKLTGKRWVSYKHNDLEHLEGLLQKYRNRDEHIVIITEAVFSMDGDVAPIAKILSLAEKYDALCYLDEAHALGVYGLEGEGFSRELTFKNYPNLLSVGTFGKSVGAGGAYIASTALFHEHLVNTLRSLIYSTALAPVMLGTIFESIGMIRHSREDGKSLLAKGEFLRKKLKQLNIPTGVSTSPIISIVVGCNERALELASHLRTNGIWAPAIRPPTVRAGTARIRLSLNNLLLEEDLVHLAECMGNFFKKYSR